MSRAGHVSRMRQMRNSYILVIKPDTRDHVGELGEYERIMIK
jgi:hypothetical protein